MRLANALKPAKFGHHQILRAYNFLRPSLKTNTDVEQLFKQFYPTSWPVLFLSARAGIHAVIETLELSSPNNVLIPPYLSHCVQSSVLSLANATTTENSDTEAKLVFHHWGYVHATLYQAILRAKEIGCARFMLGDVTGGYVNESADNKYLSTAAFKRGFAKEIEIEKNLQFVFSSLTKT